MSHKEDVEKIAKMFLIAEVKSRWGIEFSEQERQKYLLTENNIHDMILNKLYEQFPFLRPSKTLLT
jgi:hypothetical protein